MSKEFQWLKIVGIFFIVSVLGAVLYYFFTNDKLEVQKESVSNSEIKPYVKQNLGESSPPASLNFLQLVQIIKNTYPSLNISYNQSATEVKFVGGALKNDSKFLPNSNWKSIKVFRKVDSEQWSNFLVEVYNTNGYTASKKDAFELCQNIWSNIDNRVPVVITELEKRLSEYEKNDSKPLTQHLRYGYLIDLDASHYNQGYPVSCSISYDKIK